MFKKWFSRLGVGTGITIIVAVMTAVICHQAYQTHVVRGMVYDAIDAMDISLAVANIRTNQLKITEFALKQSVGADNIQWPSIKQLRMPGVVFDSTVHENPYCPDYPVGICEAGPNVNRGTILDGECGWVYKASTGELWLNTDSTKEARGVGESYWM